MTNHAHTSILLLALAGSLACAHRQRDPDAAPMSSGSDGKTMDQLFVGKFAGVDVMPAANGGLSIRIRGAGTFYGSNEPLYEIDGVPQPQGNGGIFNISPHEIEKIEVLKNAADIGVYGVRGANGVVRITTSRPGKKKSSN